MAVFGEIPRGAEDFGAYVLTADVPGTKVDVPGIRSVSVNVSSDSDTLQGDNSTIATVRNPKELTGDIEIGRINLAGLAAMAGGTVATTGTSPNGVTALDELASVAAKYFQGKVNTYSQDASGSGYTITLNKCLITDGPNETLEVEAWDTPTLGYTGIALAGSLLKRQNFETYTALA